MRLRDQIGVSVASKNVLEYLLCLSGMFGVTEPAFVDLDGDNIEGMFCCFF